VKSLQRQKELLQPLLTRSMPPTAKAISVKSHCKVCQLEKSEAPSILTWFAKVQGKGVKQALHEVYLQNKENPTPNNGSYPMWVKLCQNASTVFEGDESLDDNVCFLSNFDYIS
jgi:hypothetical protein